MTDTALALLAALGLPALGLATFLSCLAMPVPTSLMMLAAGAFAASGVMAPAGVLGAALLGAVAGDATGYALGRAAGPALTARLSHDPARAALLDKARAAIDRYGMLAIFLTRWLLSPLGPYANLLAGAAGMPPARFALAMVTGEAVWVALYVGLGYAFSAQIGAVAQLASDATGLVTSALVAALLARALWRWRRA